jgi:hypothetical protein
MPSAWASRSWRCELAHPCVPARPTNGPPPIQRPRPVCAAKILCGPCFARRLRKVLPRTISKMGPSRHDQQMATTGTFGSGPGRCAPVSFPPAASSRRGPLRREHGQDPRHLLVRTELLSRTAGRRPSWSLATRARRKPYPFPRPHGVFAVHRGAPAACSDSCLPAGGPRMT